MQSDFLGSCPDMEALTNDPGQISSDESVSR